MGRKFRTVSLADGHKQYNFFCPGCKCWHGFSTKIWNFDGNLECPTVTPSLLTTGGTDEHTCHMFITQGHFHFLNDCTHELAGKIIEMEDTNTEDF
jgi:hypothetical protein